MFKGNNKDTKTTPLASGNFEQVNAGWDIDQKVKVLFKLMVVLRINKQYAQHDISTRIPSLRVLSSPK